MIFDGAVAWAAAPMTEAVATSETLVYPVQVAPLPWPPSELAAVDGALVMPLPELEAVLDPLAVEPVTTTVPVAVAVTLAGTVPAVPETLAVPAASATGEAQSHTGELCEVSNV